MTARGVRTRRHRVAVLAYEGMTLFETGIVTEVFGLTWPGLPQPWYDLRLCTEGARPVSTLGGATLCTGAGLDVLARADTLVIPSLKPHHGGISDELATTLRRAHRRGARLVSICSGAFALAAAGVLDGRRATTHWLYAEELRRAFPDVLVDDAPLYVDEGDVLTSAGCAAGLDLALHLVRRDHGAAVAAAVARRLVVPPHRPGGQAQYVERPVTEPDDERVADSMAWALEHLDRPLTVATLAGQAHMSTRTYLRQFAGTAGTTPMRWLTGQRLDRAMELLESTDLPVDDVASAVGFEPRTFRHHFTRRAATSPSAYRRTFRGGPTR